MARPRRLYTDEKGKFYYIINKKRVFVKVPKGATQKQVQKVNVKTIVNLPETRRLKRRKKRIKAKFEKPLTKNLYSVLTKQTEGGLPYYIFKEKQQFPTLEEISKGKKDDKLLEYIKAPPRLALPPPETPKILMGEVITESERPMLMGEVIGDERKRKPLPPIPESKVETPALDLEGEPITSPLKSKVGTIKRDVQKASSDYVLKKFSKIQKIISIKDVSKNKVVNKTVYDDAVNRFNRGERKFSKSTKGEGYDNSDDDGLYNDEIEKVMKKRVSDYVPVIPADKTDDLLKYVGRGDKRFSAIINTADSNSDGTGKRGNSLGHWYSIFINNEDDYPSIEVFDPLVSEKIDDRLYNTLRKIARKMNSELYFKFKQNMLRRQKLTKSTCGWHAMKFIQDRINGIPFSEASGYDDFIEQRHKGADDSADGEKEIEKYKKKYESYI
jgi:hypothetical protein